MITRRVFVGAVAGACMAREYLVLEAIAAESMPHRLVVKGVEWAPFFEVRDYGDANVASLLNRHGLKPVSRENSRLLFAFESLEQREKTWREVSADEDWLARPSVRELAVYKPQAHLTTP